MNGWTPERRARQAALIHTWKPWKQSTGPTSIEGKAVVSGNAYAGGHGAQLRAAIKALNAALREQRGWVE